MKKPIGEMLRRLRMEKGLSQQQLADRLHVERSSVANWEAGRRMPDAAMISRLASALGMDSAALLAPAEEPDETPNVMLVDDESIILSGGLPVLREELEHTRAYLAVEQARYEGQLLVEFNTPNTFFRIPPLTLQPIVENSVKHGLDPDTEPLHVSVVTEEASDGVRIVVEDTGPGFAPSEDEPQLALDNIRERLKTMCSGTLSIEPRKVGGTRVTVFVPLPEKG